MPLRTSEIETDGRSVTSVAQSRWVPFSVCPRRGISPRRTLTLCVGLPDCATRCLRGLLKMLCDERHRRARRAPFQHTTENPRGRISWHWPKHSTVASARYQPHVLFWLCIQIVAPSVPALGAFSCAPRPGIREAPGYHRGLLVSQASSRLRSGGWLGISPRAAAMAASASAEAMSAARLRSCLRLAMRACSASQCL